MQLCKAAFAAGCHWGTFQLTNEADRRAARQAAGGARRAAASPRERFRPMLPGEVWDVPDAP